MKIQTTLTNTQTGEQITVECEINGNDFVIEETTPFTFPVRDIIGEIKELINE